MVSLSEPGTRHPGWLGVLGGMGPLATADFLTKLAKATPARTDQEHIPVLLYGNCAIHDRTLAALGLGDSPLPQLMQGVAFLAGQGVDAIAIPCNSAHCWYEQIAASVSQPVIHIVDACIQSLQRHNPKARRIGVLSTEGTARMEIYPTRLQRAGLTSLLPTPDEFSKFISPGIARVKAGDIPQAHALLDQAARRLMERGADALVLGCTEIPLGLQQDVQQCPQQYIDSTEALAQAVIRALIRQR